MPWSTFNDLISPFNLSLTVGTPDTVDFITLTPHPGNGGAFSIDTVFTITQPGSGSNTDNGSGTLSITGNTVSSGSFNWSDGASGVDVILTDGSILNINLSDVTFSSGRTGSANTVTATFDLISTPSSTLVAAVPEPASLAIFGAGVVALGWTRRKRKTQI